MCRPAIVSGDCHLFLRPGYNAWVATLVQTITFAFTVVGSVPVIKRTRLFAHTVGNRVNVYKRQKQPDRQTDSYTGNRHRNEHTASEFISVIDM